MKKVLWILSLVLVTGGTHILCEAEDIDLGRFLPQNEYILSRIKDSSAKADRKNWEPYYIFVRFIPRGFMLAEGDISKEEMDKSGHSKILIFGYDQKYRIRKILEKTKGEIKADGKGKPSSRRVKIVVKYIDKSEEVWYIDYGGRFEYSNTYDKDMKELTGRMSEEDFEELDGLLEACSETVDLEVLKQFPELLEKNKELIAPQAFGGRTSMEPFYIPVRSISALKEISGRFGKDVLFPVPRRLFLVGPADSIITSPLDVYRMWRNNLIDLSPSP